METILFYTLKFAVLYFIKKDDDGSDMIDGGIDLFI